MADGQESGEAAGAVDVTTDVDADCIVGTGDDGTGGESERLETDGAILLQMKRAWLEMVDTEGHEVLFVVEDRHDRRLPV